MPDAKTQYANTLDTPIEYLKGVGPQRAKILKLELEITTFGDLLEYYPFRYQDRTKFFRIADISEEDNFVQVKGRIQHIRKVGEGSKMRLEATLEDATGQVKLVWFKRVQWIEKQIQLYQEYIVYGRPSLFGRFFSIPHPEIEATQEATTNNSKLYPIYHSTEKLKRFSLDSKGISQLVKTILHQKIQYNPEAFSDTFCQKNQLIDRVTAYQHIHFPQTYPQLEAARRRLKFEELFFIQIQLLQKKQVRNDKYKGQVFHKTDLLTIFYENHLPFDLTNAQKRVVKEIYRDLKSGNQMNRLLQGDVGSGKTIVAFLSMLLCLSHQAQACMMAPTEILAEQHYNGLKEFADKLDIRIEKLTGSSKAAERRKLHEGLENGEIKILVGTHALIEDKVKFKNLGLCIIDEQHRFGVAQRAKLWDKNKQIPPHILVMTATPIPRTLSMTLYGDLDVSLIDELPAGRKPIRTEHRYDAQRLRVFGFLRKQIQEGRQAYIVYPLIEESEKMDYKNLMDGYESVSRAFPDVPISIVHGKMKAQDKDFEMQRFVKGETKIMVATTVIEVGVNVPNASFMIIENAERFGLAQLHQLRGRVGRGSAQSYCILMSDYKLSREGRKRLETMVKTNNGFEIAEVDMQIRGPGQMSGTQQSGIMKLQIADLAKDGEILKDARQAAQKILTQDPYFQQDENISIKNTLESVKLKQKVNWSDIS
ncbi:MAG: ATP-dependent DNA helicase RecG [Bernardetiaceae bacterium]|nr:ATP-dependent DNA helicase RecG [Bernardetiaceae bacterium]